MLPQADEESAHGYLGLLRQPVVRWVVLAGICAGLCEWGQYFWFVSYAHETLGVDEQSARLVLGFLMAGMVTGRIWQAFFPSRFSMDQKIQGLGVLAGVSLWALWLTPAGAPLAWLALCNFGAGLGVSVAFPILLGIALRAFAHDAPRLSALLMIAIALGSQVAGVLMGGLAQWMGLRVAYGTLALGSAAFVYCVWRLVRHVRLTPAGVGDSGAGSGALTGAGRANAVRRGLDSVSPVAGAPQSIVPLGVCRYTVSRIGENHVCSPV